MPDTQNNKSTQFMFREDQVCGVSALDVNDNKFFFDVYTVYGDGFVISNFAG